MCLMSLMSCCNLAATSELLLVRCNACLTSLLKSQKQGLAKGPIETDKPNTICDASRQPGARTEDEPRAVACMFVLTMGAAQPRAVTQP